MRSESQVTNDGDGSDSRDPGGDKLLYLTAGESSVRYLQFIKGRIEGMA